MDTKNGYEILYAESQPPLKLKPSANAWWTDSLKVSRLIAALEIGKSLPNACLYAKISPKQYKYFLEEHPEFNLVRNYVQVLLSIRARRTIFERLETDGRLAMRYLERTDPASYRKRWATMPYCLRCNKEVTKADIPPAYKDDFEKLDAEPPAKDPDGRYKVRPKKLRKKLSPIDRKIKKIASRLSKAENAKKERARLKLEDEEKRFEAYKERHGLRPDEGYR